MEINELKVWIDGKFDSQNIKLDDINKRLDKINGNVKQNYDNTVSIDKRLIKTETSLEIIDRISEKDRNRIDSDRKENTKSIQQLISQYGTVLVGFLVLLNMIGSWVGWW